MKNISILVVEKKCILSIATANASGCILSKGTVNSEIFVRILFFANSVKRHICDVKKSQLGHDLPISVKDSDFTIS